jgi:hypothetical protein
MNVKIANKFLQGFGKSGGSVLRRHGFGKSGGLWLIKHWFSASTFVVKIATFAKPQNVSSNGRTTQPITIDNAENDI